MAAEKKDVIERLRETIGKELKIDPTLVDENTDLSEMMNRSAVGFAKIAYEADEEFGTLITMEDVVKIRTVGDFADRLLLRLAEKKG